MPDRRVRVEKPGNAPRVVRKPELAEHIAAGWVPVWDQSLETLAIQVAVLRDALVDLAGRLPQADRPGEDPPEPRPSGPK